MRSPGKSDSVQHTPDNVVHKIIASELSIKDAAELCGMSKTTLIRRLASHPDYVKAQADGLIKRPDTAPVNVEALRTNPAVRAVANGDLSLRQACAQYPDSAPNPVTLSRWVKLAFPEAEIGAPDRKKRVSAEEMMLDEVRELAAAVVDRAKALRLDPVKLSKWVLKQVETAESGANAPD